MLFDELKKIYPMLTFSEYPASEDTYDNIVWQNGWLVIPHKTLSEAELALLKLLSQQQKTKRLTPWQAYLLQESTQLPLQHGAIRFIFYQVKQVDDFTLDQWSAALKTMFGDSVLANVILDEKNGVLVEKKENYNYQAADFEAILATLIDDFQMPAWLYIGDFTTLTPKLNLFAIFTEEYELFKVAPKKGVNTLATTALGYVSRAKIKESQLLQRLKNQIEQQKSLKEMIVALYQAQGNISSAAKKLYVHRNTLQYQIEKFEKESGFNLRNIDDLVLCYLVVL